MFLETVKSDGLAHLSYVIGDGQQCAVIDPRRDCRIYLHKARQHDARITHIFETHRNEDYVIGSTALAHRSGARVYHGRWMDFEYGHEVDDGDGFRLGSLELEILHTPGHTDESLSIAACDRDFGDEPVAVFTGDALFIGDVGRTDFFPERAREVAGKLSDSIYERILPLGDGVILCPAHGAGSVCGSGMADREFSTLGYERRFNPMLQMGREEFIDYKVDENHYIPPYFKRMEQYNLEGPPVFDNIAEPGPMDAGEFAEHRDEDNMLMLDVRSPEAHAGAYIPGSLGIPLNMVPAFAGYFLPYDRPIGIVAEDAEATKTATRYLFRMGYEETVGYLGSGLTAWEMSGRDFQSIPEITARELLERRRDGEDMTLLDVRSLDEFEAGHLPGATHLYAGHLPDRLNQIPDARPIVTFCGNGRRALIAASYLRQNGFEQVRNCLGSMAACRKLGCEVVT